MSVLTYTPNLTGAMAWWGRDAAPPADVPTWKETAYDSNERYNMATDNASYVVATNYFHSPSGPWDHAGIIIEYSVTPQELSHFKVFVNCYAASGEDAKLQVWNFDVNDWQEKDSHAGGAPGEYNLVFDTAVNPEHYRGDGLTVRVLVHSTVDAPFSVRVDYTYAQLTTASYVSGAAVLLGTGDISAAAKRTSSGSGSLAGTGTLAGSGKLTYSGKATLAGTGAISAHAAAIPRNGSAALPGTATLSGHATRLRKSSAALTGTGSLSIGGGFVLTGSATLSASAGMTVSAIAGKFGEAVLSAEGTMTVSAKLDPGGSALLIAEGALVAAAKVKRNGVAMLAGEASLEAVGVIGPYGSCIMSGEATLEVFGKVYRRGMATLEAVATLSASGQKSVYGAASLSAAAGLSCDALLSYRVYLSIPTTGMRRIHWDRFTKAYVFLDGALYTSTVKGFIDIPSGQSLRMYLEVLDRPRTIPLTPLDEVELTWTEEANLSNVWRQKVGDSWTLVRQTGDVTFVDGPLPDGTYRYKVYAVDEEGDTAVSNEESVTVSSAPEPPDDLAYTWTASTKTLRLDWEASGSDDVVSYLVRSSAGEERLNLSGSPVQDANQLYYEQVFTDESGLYLFGVRAKDNSGKVEANIEQVIGVRMLNGEPAAMLAEPRLVRVEALAGGKLRVSFIYCPWMEVNGPGAAYQARIYWDNATGTVDYSSPHATVYMGWPTEETTYSWDSAVLTDDLEYRFVVRIGTAAYPDGIETQNTDQHVAVPDSDVPDSPALTLRLV
jgi:hypothetical protein